MGGARGCCREVGGGPGRAGAGQLGVGALGVAQAQKGQGMRMWSACDHREAVEGGQRVCAYLCMSSERLRKGCVCMYVCELREAEERGCVCMCERERSRLRKEGTRCV